MRVPKLKSVTVTEAKGKREAGSQIVKSVSSPGLCVAVCLRLMHASLATRPLVLTLSLVLVDEVPPLFLARGALHCLFVYFLDLALVGCQVWEALLKVCVDLIVELGQAQCRWLDLFVEVPSGLCVLYALDSHLLLDLWQVLSLVGVEGSCRHDGM